MSIKSTAGTREIALYLQDLASSEVTLTGTQTLTNKTLTSPTITGGTTSALEGCTAVSATSTISPTVSQDYVITATSAATITLSSPSSSYNGMRVRLISNTAYAHIISGTFYNGSSAAKSTATFAAYKGCNIEFVSYGGAWFIVGTPANVTLA